MSGLSSGEGLIWAVRDPGENGDGQSDSGVADKRRIVLDGEFASTLKVLGRQGNTLSPVIRNAWILVTFAFSRRTVPRKRPERTSASLGT